MFNFSLAQIPNIVTNLLRLCVYLWTARHQYDVKQVNKMFAAVLNVENPSTKTLSNIEFFITYGIKDSTDGTKKIVTTSGIKDCTKDGTNQF